MLTKIKNELLSFTSSEKIFLLCAMVCSFCICSEYAIIRPVSNAIFLTAYGSKFFAYSWLVMVPFNLIVVALYNRFLPKLGCLKMFLILVGTIISGNVLCAIFLKQSAVLPFVFYLWKEIYVMLMFQQLWSVIHSTVKMERAKYLYGLIFAVGGAGGICGSLISGYLAVPFGSENLLFGTIPFYIAATILFFYMLKHSHESPKNEGQMQPGSFLQGAKLISSSRFLLFILLIVVFMQMTATLVYYQFNTFLEMHIGDKDLRTEYYGKVLGIVNGATVLLQVFGSFILVQFLGLRGSHMFLPAFLGINALGCLLFPIFPMITLSFITIKAFDFSIFGVIKEMLYVPLKVDEKFKAKAIIDVFAYRSSKALASFFILFFETLSILHILPWAILVFYLLWVFIALRMFKYSEENQLT